MTDASTLSQPRQLIVNADDFGQSHGVNAGIIQAHERGIVTSASMMVRASRAAAQEAADYAKHRARLSVGLHVDIGEWAYTNESWTAVYQVVPTTDSKALASQVRRQLDAFVHLVSRPPTHLDSHQHVHREEPLRGVMLALAEELGGVPLRHTDPRVRYCGGFYGQANRGVPHLSSISVEHFISLLRTLPQGTTELACHPAAFDDLPQGMYRSERLLELRTLCDPRVRHQIEHDGIRLCSFNDVR